MLVLVECRGAFNAVEAIHDLSLLGVIRNRVLGSESPRRTQDNQFVGNEGANRTRDVDLKITRTEAGTYDHETILGRCFCAFLCAADQRQGK